MRAALVVAAGALLLSCVEFKAVTATAQMGEKLSDYGPEVRSFDQTCALLRAAGEGTHCPSKTDKWQKALDMLVSYSKELDAAADERPPDVQDDVTTALDRANAAGWTSLSHDTDQNVSKVATAVAAFLARSATRASVQQAIRETGPALGKVIDLLVAHWKTEQTSLGMLRCRVACDRGETGGACPENDPGICPNGDAKSKLLFTDLAIRLDAQDAALSRAIAAVGAFGKAHAQLYANVEHLDAAELYKSVVEDIGFAAGAVDGGTRD